MFKKIAILLLWAGIVVWPAVGYGADFASLELEYRQIVASKPGTDEALNAQEKLVGLYVKEKMPAEAEAAYAVMLADFAGNAGLAKAVDHVADEYREAGDYTRALELYRYVVSRWPEAEHAVQSQGGVVKLYIKLGDEPNAAAAMGELISKFGNRKGIAGVVDEIGDTYRDVGEYGRALVLYEQVVASWPDSEQAMGSQASVVKLYMRLGDYAAASAAVEKLLGDYSQNKDIADEVDEIADAYREVKKYDKAKELYAYVVEHRSDSQQAVGSLGGMVRCCILAGDDPNAEAGIERLKEDFGGREGVGEVVHEVAYMYHHTAKDYEKARELYEWVVANHPADRKAIRAQMGIAKIFVETGDDPNAEAAIDKLVANYSENEGIAKAVDHIADEYRGLQRYDKAKELYELAVLRWPDAEHSKNALIDARKADIEALIAAGDDANALAEIESMGVDFNDNPGLVKSLFQMGERFYRKGFYYKNRQDNALSKAAFTTAAAVWDMILDRPGLYKIEDVYYFSAGCYRQLGDYVRAAEYYHAMVDGWPSNAKASDAQYRIASCYKKMMDAGRIPQVEALAVIRSACEKVISDYPDSAAFKASENMLKKIEVMESQAKIREASNEN